LPSAATVFFAPVREERPRNRLREDSLSPLLILILIVLLIAAFGGGLFVHNLLWLLLVIALIVLVVNLVSGRRTV
jgi:Flp pilus assembly protein TadB